MYDVYGIMNEDRIRLWLEKVFNDQVNRASKIRGYMMEFFLRDELKSLTKILVNIY